jgi:hypothetical protein
MGTETPNWEVDSGFHILKQLERYGYFLPSGRTKHYLPVDMIACLKAQFWTLSARAANMVSDLMSLNGAMPLQTSFSCYDVACESRQILSRLFTPCVSPSKSGHVNNSHRILYRHCLAYITLYIWKLIWLSFQLVKVTHLKARSRCLFPPSFQSAGHNLIFDCSW